MSNSKAWQTLMFSDLFANKREASWGGVSAAKEVVFTHTGKAGIYQYLMALRKSLPNRSKNIVLLPSFHCPSVVDPVIHAGYSVRFFMITERLEVDHEDYLSKLDANVVAALFIRYFGIGEIPENLLNVTRSLGVKVIHDCSHSFLRGSPLDLAGQEADASIYSFWKILPMASVGGGVWVRDKTLKTYWPEQNKTNALEDLKVGRRLAVEIKDNLLGLLFMENDAAKDARVKICVTKTYPEAYPYFKNLSTLTMPSIVRYILKSANLKNIAKLRRTNYEAFIQVLNEVSRLGLIFPALSIQDVPMGIPMLFESNKRMDYLLYSKGIPIFRFGEVLHPLLFANSESFSKVQDIAVYLSKHLLAISLHQQLSEENMREYGLKVNDVF